jgi:tetratricopeptide (TPR) repeat protein
MAKSKNQPSEVEKILGNPEELSNKLMESGEFLAKYRNIVFGVVGVVILAAAGFLYYQHDQKESNAVAQTQMYGAVLYFEMDSLRVALEGNFEVQGLLSISEEYGSTKAGKLANFYIGAIYLKQGEFQKAIDYLDKFSADDLLIQPRAYSLTGDAYMELGDFAKAESFYAKAANTNSNDEFSPVYLMKGALASELKNDFTSAIQKYNKIVNEYPLSQQANEAKKYKSRAEGLASKE